MNYKKVFITITYLFPLNTIRKSLIAYEKRCYENLFLSIKKNLFTLEIPIIFNEFFLIHFIYCESILNHFYEWCIEKMKRNCIIDWFCSQIMQLLFGVRSLKNYWILTFCRLNFKWKCLPKFWTSFFTSFWIIFDSQIFNHLNLSYSLFF